MAFGIHMNDGVQKNIEEIELDMKNDKEHRDRF